MNIKRTLLASIIIWIVSCIWGYITCGWLFNWVYAIEPIHIWQSSEAMSTNLIWMNLIGLLTAILFVLVFAIFYKGIPGQGIKKGLTYGFLVWLVGGLSGMIAMPFYMTIATTVVVYWIINALVISLINGALIGAIYKEK